MSRKTLLIIVTALAAVVIWFGTLCYLSTRFDLWPSTVVEPGAEIQVRPGGTFQ